MKKIFGAFTFCLQLVKFLKYRMCCPSEKTLKKWKTDFNWLEFTEDNKMKCKVCCWSSDARVVSTSKFVLGSSNYQLSTIKDHDKCGPPRLTENGWKRSRYSHQATRDCILYCLSRSSLYGLEKQVELETLHGVKYTGSYENDTACRNFISGIGDDLFDENV